MVYEFVLLTNDLLKEDSTVKKFLCMLMVILLSMSAFSAFAESTAAESEELPPLTEEEYTYPEEDYAEAYKANFEQAFTRVDPEKQKLGMAFELDEDKVELTIQQVGDIVELSAKFASSDESDDFVLQIGKENARFSIDGQVFEIVYNDFTQIADRFRQNNEYFENLDAAPMIEILQIMINKLVTPYAETHLDMEKGIVATYSVTSGQFFGSLAEAVDEVMANPTYVDYLYDFLAHCEIPGNAEPLPEKEELISAWPDVREMLVNGDASYVLTAEASYMSQEGMQSVAISGEVSHGGSFANVNGSINLSGNTIDSDFLFSTLSWDGYDAVEHNAELSIFGEYEVDDDEYGKYRQVNVNVGLAVDGSNIYADVYSALDETSLLLDVDTGVLFWNEDHAAEQELSLSIYGDRESGFFHAYVDLPDLDDTHLLLEGQVGTNGRYGSLEANVDFNMRQNSVTVAHANMIATRNSNGPIIVVTGQQNGEPFSCTYYEKGREVHFALYGTEFYACGQMNLDVQGKLIEMNAFGGDGVDLSWECSLDEYGMMMHDYHTVFTAIPVFESDTVMNIEIEVSDIDEGTMLGQETLRYELIPNEFEDYDLLYTAEADGETIMQMLIYAVEQTELADLSGENAVRITPELIRTLTESAF